MRAERFINFVDVIVVNNRVVNKGHLVDMDFIDVVKGELESIGGDSELSNEVDRRENLNPKFFFFVSFH